MAEQQPQGNGNGAGGTEFTLEKIYVRDLSLEVPNAPLAYEITTESQLDLNLKNSHRKVGDDLYEIVLHVSLHAKAEEKTLFIVEIEQAGLFKISGYPDEGFRQLVSAYCPATLFPYVREAISIAIGQGGFPPVHLQPINFDAIYAQAEAERGQQPS